MEAGRKRILWGVLGGALVGAGWLVVMIVSGVLEQQRQSDATARAAPEPDAGPLDAAQLPEPPPAGARP